MFLCALSWFITHSKRFDGAYDVLMLKPMRLVRYHYHTNLFMFYSYYFMQIWQFIYCIFKVNSICNMTSVAHKTLSATSANSPFATTLLGPIIAGTLVSSLGMFLPFDLGLSVLYSGCPWVIQVYMHCLGDHFLLYVFTIKASFITSTGYQLLVNNKDMFGLQHIVGSWSESNIRGCFALMWILTAFAQILFDDPHFNFFTPIHNVFYTILQVIFILK